MSAGSGQQAISLAVLQGRIGGAGRVLTCAGLMLAVVLAMYLDQLVARGVLDLGIMQWFDNRDNELFRWYLTRAMRQPGEWWVTVGSAIGLLCFHKQTWRAGGLMLLAFMPGALNALLKWAAGRTRPFKGVEAWEWDFFRGGWDGLFDLKNLSFASGHTTLAFAWAGMMAIAIPRFRVIFYVLASLCGLQRVLSGAHYLTDVLFAAVLAVVTVRVMFRILSSIVPPAKERPEGAGIV